MATLPAAFPLALPPDTHFRWHVLRPDVYLGFWVKKTETGYEETFCAAAYKFEPHKDAMSQDEWGIAIRRGTENFDVEEVFGSLRDATARIRGLLLGSPAELTPLLA